jgi:hypothetical protein
LYTKIFEDALEPGSCPDHWNLPPGEALKNATKGIDLAYNNLGVPRVTIHILIYTHTEQLVLPQEMIHPKVDEHAMMTYISCFRDLPEKKVGK